MFIPGTSQLVPWSSHSLAKRLWAARNCYATRHLATASRYKHIVV